MSYCKEEKENSLPTKMQFLKESKELNQNVLLDLYESYSCVECGLYNALLYIKRNAMALLIQSFIVPNR